MTTVARTRPAWPIPEPRVPFPDLPPGAAFLAGIDHQLHAPELAAVSRRIVESGVWRDYVTVCEEYRDYRLVYENDYVDIWVLSWMPGQETGFHDHDISEVGICTADGVIREHHLHLTHPATDHLMEPGDTQEGPFGYIHRVQHESGEPAVSVHSYSPPLAWVGQYREEGDQLRRLRQSGRTRLAPI